MIYLVVAGEYEDWHVVGLYEGPGGLEKCDLEDTCHQIYMGQLKKHQALREALMKEGGFAPEGPGRYLEDWDRYKEQVQDRLDQEAPYPESEAIAKEWLREQGCEEIEHKRIYAFGN